MLLLQLCHAEEPLGRIGHHVAIALEILRARQDA